MSIVVLSAKLVDAGRVPGATPGTALTSELILYEDGRTETGIWEVTPGVFGRGRWEVRETVRKTYVIVRNAR